MIDTLTRHGYNPDTTPLDSLMAGPVGMHLDYADAMEDDGAYPDDDLAIGFQEADPASEYIESLIEAGILS